METDKDISKLLRLKRYEQPPPGYFDDFMKEFHRRQRAELLQRPTWANLWERLLSLAPTFRVPQYAYASIVAVAVGASVFILSPRQVEMTAPLAQSTAPASSSSSFSLNSSRPVTITDTLPVSVRADGSLPPHYVIQARPVSNDQPLSF